MPCVVVGKTEECNDGFSPQSADVQIGYGEYQSRTEIVVILFLHAGVCSGPAQALQCEFQISAVFAKHLRMSWSIVQYFFIVVIEIYVTYIAKYRL